MLSVYLPRGRTGVCALVLAILAACAAPPAGALARAVDATGALAQPFERWLGGSRMPPPRVSIRIVGVSCPSLLDASGCTYRPNRVYLKWRNRFTFLHEVGHVFDYTTLGARERHEFRTILGLERSRRWYGPAFGASGHGPAVGSELFAEAYRTCATNGAREPDYTQYGYRPSARQQRRICALIRRAGR